MKKVHKAVLLAAGQGKRMNSSRPKQYLELDRRPVLYYSLAALEQSFIDEVILVINPEEEAYCRREVVDRYGFKKVRQVVPGGRERYHSVYQGLLAAGACDYVYIHDGARPFLGVELLVKLCREVEVYDACVAAVRAKDTIKIGNEEGFIDSTPNRSSIWQIQTPQVFAYHLIKKAHQELLRQEKQILANGIQITDDAMVVETFMKHQIKLVEASYQNIKITTPEDLAVAKALQKMKK